MTSSRAMGLTAAVSQEVAVDFALTDLSRRVVSSDGGQVASKMIRYPPAGVARSVADHVVIGDGRLSCVRRT